MNNQHPITPPPELVDQWWYEVKQNAKYDEPIGPLVTTKAARWGADQELEACVNYIDNNISGNKAREFRAIRRPKPPSLKEQALALVEQHEDGWRPSPKDWDTIRRALEALPND